MLDGIEAEAVFEQVGYRASTRAWSSTFHAPSAEYRADKDNFGTSRRGRWFRGAC